MATVIICVILVVFIVIGIRSMVKRAAQGCCGGGDVKHVKTDKNTSHYTYKYTMGIEGMHCKHCTQTVENALNSLGGIYAKADLKNKSAVIYSNIECDSTKWTNAVNSCGFTASEPVLCSGK